MHSQRGRSGWGVTARAPLLCLLRRGSGREHTVGVRSLGRRSLAGDPAAAVKPLRLRWRERQPVGATRPHTPRPPEPRWGDQAATSGSSLRRSLRVAPNHYPHFYGEEEGGR